MLFNRLWPLIVLALASAVVGFFFPQVPAIATGYCLLVALLWRKQSRAVEAIEGRDGVEFWLDRSSPFARPKLLRLPGLRKIAPPSLVADQPRALAQLVHLGPGARVGHRRPW